jgi:hypothetical protein
MVLTLHARFIRKFPRGESALGGAVADLLIHTLCGKRAETKPQRRLDNT